MTVKIMSVLCAAIVFCGCFYLMTSEYDKETGGNTANKRCVELVEYQNDIIDQCIETLTHLRKSLGVEE